MPAGSRPYQRWQTRVAPERLEDVLRLQTGACRGSASGAARRECLPRLVRRKKSSGDTKRAAITVIGSGTQIESHASVGGARPARKRPGLPTGSG